MPELREGSEVVFTVKNGERRGDKKKAATRVEVQPKVSYVLKVHTWCKLSIR